ncbi:MAG: aminotransferase class I/II-fold pyridoxal phosphate-dependent enzyme [Clostridium sp.]|nr:aminotransferase class I/II-fold pyridoxal phosphate-dependent enzyme [Clostridium sp.]MCM1399030.1 aminotransferase class I/II-fold pyridoxal phosphate-dependent enzyme [Clostridium sp.]MCM1459422.1 aminotransferase class I/II-fold pyridoxal phosphate-dependent enzyme [Bacteroides sp.]
MAKTPFRLEQYDTVLYNSNLNPMGIPDLVKKALSENINSIIRYPGDYYGNLKKSIAAYIGCNDKNVILGSGSSDMLRLYAALLAPKKALLPAPSPIEHEDALSMYGCEVCYYELSEDEDYRLDVVDFIKTLDSSYDMIILANPNNPTSQIINREDMETLAEACNALEIFLVIDEMYIEFTEQYEELTSTPLVNNFTNIAVIRSISKFFAVPGLRLCYSIASDGELLSLSEKIATPNSISTLTAAACTELFKDKGYIEQSRSQIYTERNLIYSAMATNKNVKLFKPYANFMLIKILKEDVTASQLAEHCKLKGIVIRNCENFHGLSDKYVRFCFMKPSQNDLLVNTMLELL